MIASDHTHIICDTHGSLTCGHGATVWLPRQLAGRDQGRFYARRAKLAISWFPFVVWRKPVRFQWGALPWLGIVQSLSSVRVSCGTSHVVWLVSRLLTSWAIPSSTQPIPPGTSLQDTVFFIWPNQLHSAGSSRGWMRYNFSSFSLSHYSYTRHTTTFTHSLHTHPAHEAYLFLGIRGSRQDLLGRRIIDGVRSTVSSASQQQYTFIHLVCYRKRCYTI